MKLTSPLGSVMRGSVCGLTFTANGYQNIVVRQRVAPVNPKTPNQETMRLAFSAMSTAWKALTQAQRDGWNDYAKSVWFPGPTGDYQITGRNMFMSNLGLITYINNRGLDTITVSVAPPSVEGVPSWASASVGAPSTSGTGICVSLGNTCGYPMNYFITISPAFDPSRERFKGPFLSASAVSDEIADSSSDDVDFLGLTLGERYFVRIVGVTTSSGHRKTFPVILNGLAQTTV